MLTVEIGTNVFSEKTDIQYVSKVFSGGEIDVRLTNPELVAEQNIRINARLKTTNDVMLLFMLTDALRQADAAKIVLYLSYLPYARQDRVCSPGEANALAVFGSLINAQNYHRVYVLDPHSNVAGTAIKNMRPIDNLKFVMASIKLLKTILPQSVKEQNELYAQLDEIKGIKDALVKSRNYDAACDARDRELEIQRQISAYSGGLVIVSPDAGAISKTTKVVKQLMKSGNVIKYVEATKVRDRTTNEIVGTTVNDIGNDVRNSICVIVDDICDGGRTFIGLAQELRNRGASKVVLIVTHGIFSYGLEPLVGTVDIVISTDSFNTPEPVDGIEYHQILVFNI